MTKAIMNINHLEAASFIEEELNTITLPSEHTSPMVGTQVGRDLTG